MYKTAELTDLGSLQKVIKRAMWLTWKVKKIPEDKDAHMLAILSNEAFYVSGWSSWEDDKTGEKLILLIGNDKSVLTDFRNVDRFEIYYEKPRGSGAIGIKYREGELAAQGK